MEEKLLPRHGGYRNLKSFQIARLVYDLTAMFCNSYVEKYSRSRDQMVQAARSGVQNIAEGSQASATSKKTEIKLTQVARASLEELKLDFEDYLRQRNHSCWARDCSCRQELIDRRFHELKDVLQWIKLCVHREHQSEVEVFANTALVLINVACSLLDRQVASLARSFQKEGGFSERLYRYRRGARESGRRGEGSGR